MNEQRWIALATCVVVFTAALWFGLGWLAVACWLVAGGILFREGRR